jgi:hypothetical protein
MATDIATALAQPGCERLREWASIGPVQMAALELFVDELGTPHCTEKLNALHVNHIALQAECEALRLKAARYDWLREQDGLCLEMLMDKCFTCTDVDEAIDAAMGKEKA